MIDIWKTLKLLWERPIGTLQTISTHMRLVLEELKETMKSVNVQRMHSRANDRDREELSRSYRCTDRLSEKV